LRSVNSYFYDDNDDDDDDDDNNDWKDDRKYKYDNIKIKI
jgi:hypothetical protein